MKADIRRAAGGKAELRVKFWSAVDQVRARHHLLSLAESQRCPRSTLRSTGLGGDGHSLGERKPRRAREEWELMDMVDCKMESWCWDFKIDLLEWCSVYGFWGQLDGSGLHRTSSQCFKTQSIKPIWNPSQHWCNKSLINRNWRSSRKCRTISFECKWMLSQMTCRRLG